MLSSKCKEGIMYNVYLFSVLQYDLASFDFGFVTNNGVDGSNYMESMIFIDYDAVMIDNAGTVNGSIYWVSAGIEYQNVTEIWVCQNSFMTITDIEVRLTNEHVNISKLFLPAIINPTYL